MAARTITTTLAQLMIALGSTIEDLRRDRRYRKVTGEEVIVLAPRTESPGSQLHIIAAPPWLPVQDFSPIPPSWARRAGWYT